MNRALLLSYHTSALARHIYTKKSPIYECQKRPIYRNRALLLSYRTLPQRARQLLWQQRSDYVRKYPRAPKEIHICGKKPI